MSVRNVHPDAWTRLFRGAASKAAGWQAAGYSAGFKRVAVDFYEAHERPKQLCLREPVKHAARKLRARHVTQDGRVVVLDGKALRGSLGAQLVGAVNAQSGRTLGVEAVADKSNVIPAGRTLPERLELDSAIALMDALHTRVRTARSIAREGGGDFVLFVKGNQSGLLAQAQHSLPGDFSPSTVARGARPRTNRMARTTPDCRQCPGNPAPCSAGGIPGLGSPPTQSPRQHLSRLPRKNEPARRQGTSVPAWPSSQTLERP